MTAYIRFRQNGLPVQGTVRNGAYAGWSELLGFSMGGQASAAGPTVQIKTFVCPSRRTSMLMEWSLAAPSSRTFAGHGNTYGGLTTVNEGIFSLGPLGPAGKGKLVKIDFCKTDAEVDFGTAGGRAAGLRFVIHDVRVVRYQRHGGAAGPVFKASNFLTADPAATGARGATPTDHIVIAYSRMTHAGALSSAPDISHLVRTRQAHPNFFAFEPAFRGGVFVG